jgi:hypothetical protein
MSIQYASATGTGNFGANSTQLTELPNVTLQPGQYYLVQQAAGAGNGVPLPTPDLVDATPIAMAAGAGKVALADGATSLGLQRRQHRVQPGTAGADHRSGRLRQRELLRRHCCRPNAVEHDRWPPCR